MKSVAISEVQGSTIDCFADIGSMELEGQNLALLTELVSHIDLRSGAERRRQIKPCKESFVVTMPSRIANGKGSLHVMIFPGLGQ